MKYLDAKRRLIFMMATVKYIRLKMINQPTVVTDDYIKAIIVKSAPMYCDPQTLTIKDINQLVSGIKTILVFGKEQPIITKDFANIITKRLSTIMGWGESKFEESLKIVFPYLKGIFLEDTAKALEQLKLNPTAINALKAFTDVELLENLKIAPTQIKKLTADESINVANNIGISMGVIKSLSSSAGIELTSNAILDIYKLTGQMIRIIDSIYSEGILNISSSPTLQIKIANEFKVDRSFILTILSALNIPVIHTTNIIDNAEIDFLKTISMKMLEKLESSSTFDLEKAKITYLYATNVMNMLTTLKPNIASSNKLQLKDETTIEDVVIVELRNFITVALDIVEELNMNDFARISKASSSAKEIIAKLYVLNEVLPKILPSKQLGYDYTNDIDNLVGIEVAKYALIEDFDDVDIGDLLNKELDELIYVKV